MPRRHCASPYRGASPEQSQLGHELRLRVQAGQSPQRVLSRAGVKAWGAGRLSGLPSCRQSAAFSVHTVERRKKRAGSSDQTAIGTDSRIAGMGTLVRTSTTKTGIIGWSGRGTSTEAEERQRRARDKEAPCHCRSAAPPSKAEFRQRPSQESRCPGVTRGGAYNDVASRQGVKHRACTQRRNSSVRAGSKSVCPSAKSTHDIPSSAAGAPRDLRPGIDKPERPRAQAHREPSRPMRQVRTQTKTSRSRQKDDPVDVRPGSSPHRIDRYVTMTCSPHYADTAKGPANRGSCAARVCPVTRRPSSSLFTSVGYDAE